MSREFEFKEGQAVGYVIKDSSQEYRTKQGVIAGIAKHGVFLKGGIYVLDYKLQRVIPGFGETDTEDEDKKQKRRPR